MRQELGDHAVVLGAGMAGLLAARVLTDAYRKVTIIDRDAMPEIGAHRRGVPQGRHLHGLHPRGRAVLEELFPGFTAHAVQAGAQEGDVLGHCRWLLSGYRLRQAEIGLPGLIASRPFLEGQVRARVRALPSVTFIERADIVGLTTTAGRRVTGAQVRDRAGEHVQVPTDLVVDATGRGSRTPVWLAEWGYQPPAEDRIDIGLGYATRTYRLRPGALGQDKLITIGATPHNPRTAALVALEGDRHMVTLGGILGDHPPTDPAGFDAFAASLPFADITEAIAGAQSLDNPVAFRFPASVRRRYERLRQFPDGLLVLGDAVCSFNPVYGQGMTVAANQALVLRRLVTRSVVPAPDQYFRAIAKTINPPWDFAVGADLAFPGVPGARTGKIRMANAYLPRLLAAASSEVALGAAFIRVLGLLDRPEGLLRPGRVLRVWWINRRHPARAVAGVTPSPGAPPRDDDSTPVSSSSVTS
ncbi:MAG TPA: FAD-binding monooxygenase [Pseudonocardiaceae bacterium]|jgi:2-polyprenyl-6-methoxyphenol hydroxylase-like FAD-dependent oxidoreductase|nr:FAD-binding monooxygenase [Pseudonocardiaceae bacterium]